MQSKSSDLAMYLERVLERESSLEQLLRSPGSMAMVVEPCAGNLWHFAADQDIRDRDPGYRDMQERAMRRLIELLREGASPEELAKVSFLG